MSTSTAIAEPRGRGLTALFNPIISRLLRRGVSFGPNVLLTVRGRKSGLPRTFPVAVLEHAGRRFIQSPFGEVDWVRNLRAHGGATITKGRDSRSVTAIELPPETGGPILEASMARYLGSRFGRAAIGRFFGLGPASPTEDYVAVARRHPMFELVPAPEAGGEGASVRG